MEKGEDGVNHTRFFQQGLPGKRTQQEIHPHGKDENQYDEAVLVHVHMRQDHGQRVSKQKTDQRAD